jgi:membrane protease YdiL (CAAX protease family)
MGVTRFIRSGAGAVLLWVVSAMVLAAVLAPWIYQGGKAFAEYAAARRMAGIGGLFGEACQRAEFGRFYNRSLLLAVLLLLPLLLRRLRHLRRTGGALLASGPPLAWQTGVFQGVVGWLVASAVVCGLGMGAEWLGVFTTQPVMPALSAMLTQALIPAVGVSVLEEGVFRGVLLGLWLRVARPWAACIGSSLVFAFLHFLEPPLAAGMVDASSAAAGFQLLGWILWQFTEPMFFVADFLTFFTLGLILAATRMRTGHLWLAIGLHCGWVNAFKAYHLTHVKAVDGPLNGWWIGDSLRSGLLPLAALVISAWICHWVLKMSGSQAKNKPL